MRPRAGRQKWEWGVLAITGRPNEAGHYGPGRKNASYRFDAGISRSRQRGKSTGLKGAGPTAPGPTAPGPAASMIRRRASGSRIRAVKG